MSNLKNKSVALVYDRINKWGGAERVLLALHDLFPQAPLYTAVNNPRKAPWAKVFTIRTSFLQHFPLASSNHEILPFLMPIAFESFSFDEFDLVISVTSEAAKGIITKPYTKHICYCLTPTRYLWSGYNEYFTNNIMRSLSKPVVSYLRNWDKIASQRPDLYIGISKEVQQRIKSYYDRESVVVYPPVNLGDLRKGKGERGKIEYPSLFTLNASTFFLVVSRLVPYKKIDLAVQACNSLKKPLVIIGTGSDELRLKKMAGPTVKFLGKVTDDLLIEYYKRSKALIFPGHEDFGISMVEALLCGKPVIAYQAGGALEILEEGKTGIFFSDQSAGAICRAIQEFETKQFNTADCYRQAKKFSIHNFNHNFMQTITDYLKLNADFS